MNDQELRDRLKTLEGKVDKIFISSEKTRKYFLWMLIVTLVLFILPLIGLVFVIPSLLDTYSSIGNF